MKIYVDELPKNYRECPFIQNNHATHNYCLAAHTYCPRFRSSASYEAASKTECLCLKVLPETSQISNLEE